MLAVFLATLAAAPVALADLSTIPDETAVANGPVDEVVSTPSATYIGGRFTEVGPRTGPGVGIDTSTGQSTDLPEVSGVFAYVQAVATDGSGGFFIGGRFSHVGGLRRRNLAHILPDGSVDPDFAPDTDYDVYALAVSGSTLYVGGDFSSVGGKRRSSLAAVRTTDGVVTGWNPGVGGEVEALAVSNGIVYVGGGFGRIGGKRRRNVAAVDAGTGRVTSWNPGTGDSLDLVDALTVSDSRVYAGGDFMEIGGKERHGLAAIRVSDGRATSWNPEQNACCINALALSGATLYVAGDFTLIGGKRRDGLAAVDTGTANATSWDPDPSDRFGPFIVALAVSGSRVYVGGWFKTIGGKRRHDIAALNTTTGAATSWNPDANDAVFAFGVTDSTVYAGGEFTSINGERRRNLAALDSASGDVTSWNPQADREVISLAASGSKIYVGGKFTKVRGKQRNHIAAIDAATGKPTSWNPDADRPVWALATSGSRVYAGGSFNSIGGKARHRLAAIRAGNGTATRWNPDPESRKYEVSYIRTIVVSGSRVYVGGYFKRIGGRTRHNLSAIRAASGRATSWNPDPNAPVASLAVSDSTVYAGGYFHRIGGKRRHRLAAIRAGSGRVTRWNPDVRGSLEPDFHDPGGVYALVVVGPTVYAGGSFRSVGGEAHPSIVAISTATGAAKGWKPRPAGGIFALDAGTDGSVWAGGDFPGFEAAPQSNIARFSP